MFNFCKEQQGVRPKQPRGLIRIKRWQNKTKTRAAKQTASTRAEHTKHCQKSLSENLDSVGSRPPGTANWGIQRGMFREDKESNIRTTAHKRFAENRVVVGVAG